MAIKKFDVKKHYIVPFTPFCFMNDKNVTHRLSLLQATAINMTDMVGIGPFVVLSSVAGIMNGPSFYMPGLRALSYLLPMPPSGVS